MKRIPVLTITKNNIRYLAVCLMLTLMGPNYPVIAKNDVTVPCIEYSFDAPGFLRGVGVGLSGTVEEAIKLARIDACKIIKMKMGSEDHGLVFSGQNSKCVALISMSCTSFDDEDMEMVCSDVKQNEKGEYEVLAAFQLAKDKIKALSIPDEDHILLEKKIKELADFCESILSR